MKRGGGFTLVELLLAVTLLSMLLALAYGGLHAATRATDRGQQILEESGRLRMAHQFVRKQLNQAIPLAFNQAEGNTANATTNASAKIKESEVFLGSARSMRFVGPMPGYLGFGGPQVQELSIVSGDNGLELVLEHALVQGFEESSLSERDPIVLIDRINSAEFRFQGRDEEGELLPWINSWEETDTMPVAISLDIEFEEGAYTDWPLLVAAVRVDGSVAAGVNGPTTYQSAIQEMIQRRQKRN